MTADVVPLRTYLTPAERARLRAIEAAAADLLRKLAEHESRQYERISLGALHALRDAYRGPGGAA